MKIVLFLVTCAVSLFWSGSAAAQKEYHIWHFGYQAGIDFNVTPPQAITGPYTTLIDASATICDPVTGELLISTDGTTVWNRDLEVMPNGRGLLGGYGSSTQGVLILPFPTKQDLYYIFTCDQAGYIDSTQGVKYSVVDMTLDGGKGDVVRKNVDLFAPPMTEKLTAVRHSNGCDYWVIAHQQGGPNFMAIHVSDSIVGSTVISPVGQTVSPDTTRQSVGCLAANNAGTQLAYANNAGSLWLYDFDPSTGVVSNPQLIFDGTDALYGVCFSPDDSKLYLGSVAQLGFLLQYDVTLPTAIEIANSQKIVFIDAVYGVAAIRPGPDGKLYAPLYPTRRPAAIGVINNPNADGTACNFDPNGLTLISSTQSQLGLPNVIDGFVGKSMRPCLPPPEPVSTDADIGIVCAGDCIQFTEVGAGTRKVIWRVSDGRTIEDVAAPSICFTTAGEFTVELLAIGARRDTARSIVVSVTVKPALNFKLQPYSIVTDTIGAVIKVPIILSERVNSRFDASFSFNPEELEYAGAFDHNGIPIDLGSRPETGELTISKELSRDSVVGYLYFNLYWEKDAHCRSVQLIDYSLSNASVRCLNSDVNYEMCLDEACGTPILSEYLRTSKVELSISPNPSASVIALSSTLDVTSGQLTVIDANGKLMNRKPVTLKGGQPYSVDVSHLANGIYFLLLDSEQGSVRKSIAIQR